VYWIGREIYKTSPAGVKTAYRVKSPGMNVTEGSRFGGKRSRIWRLEDKFTKIDEDAPTNLQKKHGEGNLLYLLP